MPRQGYMQFETEMNFNPLDILDGTLKSYPYDEENSQNIKMKWVEYLLGVIVIMNGK